MGLTLGYGYAWTQFCRLFFRIGYERFMDETYPQLRRSCRACSARLSHEHRGSLCDGRACVNAAQKASA
jgi:hypothetical protein